MNSPFQLSELYSSFEVQSREVGMKSARGDFWEAEFGAAMVLGEA